MPCNCKDVDFGTYKNYVPLPCPRHMDQYRENRNKAGLNTDWIGVDRCILEEILWLWRRGIITYGCCCGHNKAEPFVNVDPGQCELMQSMGYELNHVDPERRDTFRLKLDEFVWSD